MALSQPHHLKQAGFSALLIVLILVLESKAAVGAFHSVLDDVAAFQHAALSVVCSLLAFFTFGFAGRLKDDERPHIARRAKLARTIALCFLAVPIGYLGSAFKLDRLEARWESYIHSPAYTADQALVSDMMNDRYEREEAQRRLIQPTTPDLELTDGEWWMAAFFQIVLIFASDALRVPAPITEAERQTIMFKQRGQKAAATRKARAKAKAEKKKRRFRVFEGGQAASN